MGSPINMVIAYPSLENLKGGFRREVIKIER
jgi:hypothetical protein